MTFFLRYLAGTMLALSCTLNAAKAQTVHGPEAQYSYASVKGWSVSALSLKDGVHGCRATKSGAQGQVMIEKYQNEWNLIVPSRQGGTFTGGIVSIDGYKIDSQFGLRNGYGIKPLTLRTLERLKKGATLSVRVNGDLSLSWSLSGSTAAILKVEECAANGGERPTAGSSGTNPQPQNDVIYVTCRPIAGENYPCTINHRKNDPGYIETVMIAPQSGNAPKYFFKIRPSAELADVWIAFGREKWKPAGVWKLSDDGVQRCAIPVAQQSPQAQRTLGQDAWQLCLQ